MTAPDLDALVRDRERAWGGQEVLALVEAYREQQRVNEALADHVVQLEDELRAQRSGGTTGQQPQQRQEDDDHE